MTTITNLIARWNVLLSLPIHTQDDFDKMDVIEDSLGAVPAVDSDEVNAKLGFSMHVEIRDCPALVASLVQGSMRDVARLAAAIPLAA